MSATPTVTLTPRATRAAKRGRPWFFADDLEQTDAADGDVVQVRSDRSQAMAIGLYAERARIRLRICGGAPPRSATAFEDFLRARLRASISRREALRGPRAGVRLVHAEADGIPGLVVDQYADCAVVQISAAAVEAHRDAIVAALVDELAPRSLVARHDIAVRELEGLGQDVELLHGERQERVEIEEHGVVHGVHPFDGHKTGFYLDQRDTRLAVQRIASGRRVVDLFSYQGGFSLAALSGGATSAIAIDQSASALERASAAASANGFEGLEIRRANAFEALRELRAAGEAFDLVIVDPPPFAKSKREIAGGKRGYRDLNRHALRVLAPDGLLLSCSCSHHVTPPMFEDLLRQAAAGLRFRVMLRQRLLAGADHPACLSLPESEYLKSCLLQRVDLDP